MRKKWTKAGACLLLGVSLLSLTACSQGDTQSAEADTSQEADSSSISGIYTNTLTGEDMRDRLVASWSAVTHLDTLTQQNNLILTEANSTMDSDGDNVTLKTPEYYTFVADLTATPTFNNFGSFTYDNMEEFQISEDDQFVPGALPHFVNYVEGIYVGYRFYETAAEEGLINYDEAVVYPFGYGLSYTTFTQTLDDMTVTDDTVSVNVTVTNTGDVAGKDVVEVYYTPPYTNGGIEKASVNLAAFDKTDMLEPGASQTMTLTFSIEDMASYDYQNAQAYVLEAGDYVISLRSDSHNVIDSRIYNVADTITYSGDNARSTDLTTATNQFDFAEGDIEYLSRADGFANFDEVTAAPASYSMPEDDKAQFTNNSNWVPEEDPDAEMPTTGADNGLTLADMRWLMR